MYEVRMSQPQRRLRSESQLLSAACRVAVRVGIQGLTCEEVGRLAGYSRGQTYQRFGSREGLLVAAVRYLNARRKHLTSELCLANHNGIDALMHHFSAHVRAASADFEQAAFFEILSAHIPDLPAMRNAVAIAKSDLLDEVGLLIRKGLADATINPAINCEEDAVLYLRLMLGVATECAISGRDDDLLDLRERGQEMVRRSFSRLTVGNC